MKFLWFFLFCWDIAFFAQGQNLVPNGSFEDFTSCPSDLDQIDNLYGWYKILNTPDNFNECATVWYASVPNNLAGAQEPFEGNGYAGCATFDFTFNYREIFGTELIDTLNPLKTYQVSMRVSRANGYIFTAASNKLGIKFTTKALTLGNTQVVDNFAQLYSDTFITDSTNWVLLHWNYTPDSPYSHVYIGNFFDDAHTDTIALGGFPASVYYYIDSVIIECVGNDCISNLSNDDNAPAHIQFSSDGSSISISFSAGVLALVNLADIYGRVVFSEHSYSSLKIPTKFFSSGIYLLQIQIDKDRFIKKIIIIN
jgi:hypothetical protein